jgi:hypothetical protein
MMTNNPKSKGVNRDQRRARWQRIVIVVISILVILSWIIALIAK